MTRDRSEAMNRRSGLLGWFDHVRYKEIYRQALGLVLIAVCAWLAEPGTQKAVIGLVLAALGQIYRTYAAGSIFKNRQLATSGAYAMVRHPLYLGNILILGGFALAAGSLAVAAIIVIFFLVWYPAAIRYEDQKLEKMFGEDWRKWSQGTHAVLPRSFSFKSFSGVDWSAHQSLIRNGELYITLYLAACAAWLWYGVQA
ncbi:MAG: isoprenylcysteine carboxylmethyltransferase family protein [Xanthomonadales bacterium]|nr:isoprenylcysteine carboxylmethyltransferase family protein [Gammaproteobacteria bacterium]NNE06772.1 isoprenylcysteine carboxylmethyltransferase family protein [Xanthomonadales bacterium]NNL94354.1 isoprenylcysteine carboxylmethyltransferase family protein [Xanthomonadales bacterium]